MPDLLKQDSFEIFRSINFGNNTLDTERQFKFKKMKTFRNKTKIENKNQCWSSRNKWDPPIKFNPTPPAFNETNSTYCKKSTY